MNVAEEKGFDIYVTIVKFETPPELLWGGDACIVILKTFRSLGVTHKRQ